MCLFVTVQSSFKKIINKALSLLNLFNSCTCCLMKDQRTAFMVVVKNVSVLAENQLLS